MNRRQLLGTLLGAAAGLVLDPERLLWIPGQRKIFIPPLAPLQKLEVGDLVVSGPFSAIRTLQDGDAVKIKDKDKDKDKKGTNGAQRASS